MTNLINMISSIIWANGIILAIAFYLLFKSADFLVDSAVGISKLYNIPKLIVGIVIVGFGTTAPEIAVSVQSAILNHAEMAFGNAVGSVICDEGIALAMVGILAPAAIFVEKKLFKLTALFLILINLIAYFLVKDGSISRLNGIALVSFLFIYLGTLFFYEKKRKKKFPQKKAEVIEDKGKKLVRYIGIFVLSLIGILIASRGAIWSAVNIAHVFKISDSIIGLTVIAIGTSLPEISTAISATRKGHGELAIGDILGADILNLAWIIGVTAIIRPIEVAQQTIHFSFWWMFAFVSVALITIRIKFQFSRWKGIILLVMYVIYLISTIRIFYF